MRTTLTALATGLLALAAGCAGTAIPASTTDKPTPTPSLSRARDTATAEDDLEAAYLDALFPMMGFGSAEALGVSETELLDQAEQLCEAAEAGSLTEDVLARASQTAPAHGRILLTRQLTHGHLLCPGTEDAFADALSAFTDDRSAPKATPTPHVQAEPAPQATERPAPAPTRAPAAPQPPAPAPHAPPETEDSFDEDYARTVLGWIVEDVATADERMSDRPDIGGSASMSFLADDMRRLLEAGIPPVADDSGYYALVATLEEFFAQAAAQLPSDIPGAAATYTIAREHTEELLDILNPVLGTSHTLPAWS